VKETRSNSQLREQQKTLTVTEINGLPASYDPEDHFTKCTLPGNEPLARSTPMSPFLEDRKFSFDGEYLSPILMGLKIGGIQGD